MLSLAETQALVRAAIVDGDASVVSPLLVGGLESRRRLRVHQRHYESSLTTALLGKFPATAWLVGTRFVEQYARAFAHQHPPQAPCIAEYGADFPEFLSKRPGVEHVPYLRSFGELEWAVGAVSIAVERVPVNVHRLSGIATTVLPEVVLTLQPGLRLLRADWPVDQLMTLHLTDTAPEQLALEPAETCIQLRGGRGRFHIERLNQGDFLFRQTVAGGLPLGEAAARALETVATFDPGQALGALFAEELVTAITPADAGQPK